VQGLMVGGRSYNKDSVSRVLVGSSQKMQTTRTDNSAQVGLTVRDMKLWLGCAGSCSSERLRIFASTLFRAPRRLP